jgi:hypothetical protein
MSAGRQHLCLVRAVRHTGEHVREGTATGPDVLCVAVGGSLQPLVYPTPGRRSNAGCCQFDLPDGRNHDAKNHSTST